MVSLPFLLLLFLSDALDGFLARRWDVASDFGYILDGVADRSTHIALIVALTATGALSALLGFLLIFRDLVLYAARAFFDGWWTANAIFRSRVKLAAVAFKLTVGTIAVVSYMRAIEPNALSSGTAEVILRFAHSTTWLFVGWSYLLLAQQVHEYSSRPRHRGLDR